MAKYDVTPLNYNGSPNFGKSRTIDATESKLFIELSKEIDNGVPGFYIYQANNRSGLKIRFLTKEYGYFIVRNADGKKITQFTVSKPKTKTPTPKPKPTPKQVSPSKSKIYDYILECEEPFLRIPARVSPKFETVRQLYAHAYATLNNHKHKEAMVCVVQKNGDFIRPPRNIFWMNGMVVMDTYGKDSKRFRILADGSVKKM